MKKKLVAGWSLIRASITGWSDDGISMHGAALAYYTIFSIAPLLLIAMAVVGWFYGPDASRGQVFVAIRGLVGDSGAQAIESMVKAASSRSGAGIFAAAVSTVTLIAGASAVFSQIQTSLNMIWKVRSQPSRGLWNMVRQRLLSFSMVVTIGFLLLVSMLLSAAIAAAGHFVNHLIPGGAPVWQLVNLAVSLGVATLLFAAVYKILPDVHLDWSDVWVGAGATAVFFSIGKLLVGLYLGITGASSAYGAAGSILAVLLWVYYSSAILFFGAEFCRAYALRDGRHVEPSPGTEYYNVETPKSERPGSRVASGRPDQRSAA